MLLAGAMLLPANAFAASPDDFSDFPTDWSAASVRRAVDNGLLNGSNGLINSKGLLTRAQMAAIINRAFGASKSADLSGYTDVLSNAWYANDMGKAVAMRTFVGSNGLLSPEKPITREEAFTVLARAFELDGGSASALNGYSDGASVSAWAQSAVAALVENGYVNGADGRLNPKSSITRAEFAKVIGEMADTYADADDSLSDTIDGSVIVRENGVSLAGKTINGDLIIADGMTVADLSNVTVTGRIVLRGGESGVTFSNTKAGKGILANTDVTVAGKVDAITVGQSSTITVKSGASVGTITASAEGAKIVGAGKVENVQANANNISVTVSGTKVTAAEGTSGVKAGSKNVASGKTETVSNTTSGGGSSSGGSSSGGSSGGGSSSGGSSSTVTAEIAAAKVVRTEAGSYLTLTFGSDYRLNGTTITVDGADVTKYATPVTDDGKIAKLPLVADPGSVTLKNGNKTQTTAIGTAQADAVYTGEDYLPDYFVKHGPLALWDYYLTNYDDEGNARILPNKTTFGTTAAVNPHPSYAAPVVLDEHDNGKVVIMFNYETDEDKAWFDNIVPYSKDNDGNGAVQLVAYDQYKSTWNYNLNFTVEKNVDHKDYYGNVNKVATITIPFNQDNFRNNGRYYVRVRSKDANDVTSASLTAVHVQQNAVPTLRIKNYPTSGEKLYFEVGNLVYGITDPIEKVTLTGPTGTTELNKIDDYYLFSQDLFVLYNDKTNHLQAAGDYTLTIEANGFQTFSCKFKVNKGEEPAKQTAITLDAISRATGGSSSGGGSSDSGGGYAISTDFLFDSDLLANALVLEELHANTTASDTVLKYWYENISTLDSVFNTGDTMYYDGPSYITKTNQADVWLPYAEFVKTAAATVNPPHATKAILEDGLLGDVQDSSVSGKLEAVAPTVSNKEQGKDVTLTFENGSDYVSKITGLYLNGDWKALEKDKYYTVDGNTITIKQELLHIGDNEVRIEATGFKSQTVKFKYEKVNESVSLSEAKVDTDAHTVSFTVDGSDGDFLKNLYSVTLTKDSTEHPVWEYGVGGRDAVYYSIGKDCKTITLHNVTEPGDYSVSIKANYYDTALTKAFEIAGTVVIADAPNMTITQTEEKGVYTLAFNGKKNEANEDITTRNDIDAWASKVTTVKVNGTAYTRIEGMDTIWTKPDATSENYILGIGSQTQELTLGGGAFHEGKNTVTISATGYHDWEYTIIKESSGSTDPVDPNPTPDPDPDTPSDTEIKVPMTAPTVTSVSMYSSNCILDFSNYKAWVQNIKSIKVDGSAYKAVTSSNDVGSGKYYLDTVNGHIYMYLYVSSYSPKKIVISAEGCDKVILTATAGSGYSDPPVISTIETTPAVVSAAPAVANIEEVPASFVTSAFYRVSFDRDVEEYLNNVTQVILNGDELKSGSIYDDTTKTFKVGTDSTYGKKSYLDFSTDCFTDGTTTVVVKADDYKDLTFTVTVTDGMLTIQ